MRTTKLYDKTSELLRMEEVEADQEILKLTSDVEAQTQKWLDQPIGKIEGDMLITDSFSVRTS